MRGLRAIAAAAVLALAWTGAAQAAAPPVSVFAAASLRESLTAAGDAFTKQGGAPVQFSFAGSNTLAKQVEQGAPADLVMTADAEWMDWMAQRKLIAPASRRTLLRNRLVLVAPADAKTALKLKPGVDLAGALGADGRLAVADASVPAGRYARAALTALGVWPSVKDRLAPAADVRAALAFVARGEAPLGVVYATDAKVDPKVRVADVFAERLHPPIVYPAALVAGRQKSNAAAFLRFLQSPKAAAIFQSYGFTLAR